ncbi:MAG: hypothetical protein FJ108_06510 [Deltaproteobacteria bacterium]|nr:hypothetical protein [Deltaproteobacteria bacterium]
MTKKNLARTIALFATLACALGAHAQGDLDILLRRVPPVVMIQFDTSGSMRQMVLPEKYRTDRGSANPEFWFHWPVNSTSTRPAVYRDVSTSPNNWEDSGTGNGTSTENYERTCQIFPSSSNSSYSQAVCMSALNPASQPSCADDDNFGSQINSGAVIKCWNVPGGCTNVPSGLTCSTTNRARRREGGTTVSQPFTTVTLPDVSYTSTSLYSPNYLFWIMNEIYKGNTPVNFIAQDRLAAAKQAVTALVNEMNVDGQDPKVKFGLARYDGVNNNGGYVVVPADLNNKTSLLAAVTTLPASGSTPLSETLVDVGRYLAGSSLLGSYTQYNRNTSGSTVTASSAPQSPVTSHCDKIFIVVVTDGLPTSDANDHHGTAFTSTIGAYVDGDGDYTDDVAAYLFDTDLRPTIDEKQNAITYTVGFSLDSPLLQHVADRGDGEYYSSSDADELAAVLSTAVTDILHRNATLTAANVPASRTLFGDGFYTAYFAPGGRRSLWPGHLQAFRVDETLTVVDAANQPAIDPLTNLFYEPRNPYWDAADTLLADFASRTIYTTKSGARAPFTTSGITASDLGVLLSEEPQYPQDPTAIDFTTAEQLADAVVNFTHGFDAFDEDEDGSTTDVREFVLGDIFHSNPLAIGPPLSYLRNETGYGPESLTNTFMYTYKHRDRVMYVGANDGMLHAFSAGSFVDPSPSVTGDEYYTAGDGRERFAYIPAAVLPKIKDLPKWDQGKIYAVDGASAAADVWIDYNMNSAKEGTDWTTVLLTPLREGGESLLALDVTDPTATAGYHGPYPRLMWEFTHSRLGQTWSKPIFTKLKIRAGLGVGDRCGIDNGDGDCVEEWVAIFGAGYWTQGDPNLLSYTNDPNSASYSTKGRGVFIVRVKDGTILGQLAQDPNSATYSKMRYAIPAEPAVLDLNFDGFADVVYIGDLGGQLWKWDLSAVGVPVSGVVPNSIWPAGVMFEAPVATTAGGVLHYHSIFQSAAAAFNDRVLTLSFASGERANLGYRGQEDPNDPNDIVGLYDDNNRFWVLKDRTPTGSGAFPVTAPAYEEPLWPATVPLSGHGQLTDMTNAASDPNATDDGYFFRVPDGEKFITNHLIFAGNVATVSYTPDEPGAAASANCYIGGKTAEWAWSLDDGAASLVDPSDGVSMVRTRVIGNGAPTDPRITVSRDSTGKIIVRITAQTSTGEVTNPDGGGLTLDPVDMIYWRQNF